MHPLPAPPASLQAVLFDLDGTLANTLPLCIEAFRQAIEPATGQALTDEAIIATFGPSEEGTIRALAPAHYEESLAAYLRHYERLHPQYDTPFAGISELLHDLRHLGASRFLLPQRQLASQTGAGTAACSRPLCPSPGLGAPL
ncbi:MAG: hypothetical protein EOO56_15770, partial [Hymenobacter sp.]